MKCELAFSYFLYGARNWYLVVEWPCFDYESYYSYRWIFLIEQVKALTNPGKHAKRISLLKLLNRRCIYSSHGLRGPWGSFIPYINTSDYLTRPWLRALTIREKLRRLRGLRREGARASYLRSVLLRVSWRTWRYLREEIATVNTVYYTGRDRIRLPVGRSGFTCTIRNIYLYE